MIQLDDTSLAYNPTPQVLHGITLDVQQGEFVSLLGPSGCGKSRLLRLIAGLVEPSGGQLSIDGQPARRFRQANTGVSLLFQEPRLLPWRSVRRNIALPLELSRIAPADQAALVEASLALVRLLPKSSDADFAAVTLGFDDAALRRLVLDDRLGQQTRVDLDTVRNNPPVPPGTFRFEIPPGADVIDDSEL